MSGVTPNGKLLSILTELASLREELLREILRPHLEIDRIAPPTKETVTRRKRLDLALDYILLLEAAAQLGDPEQHLPKPDADALKVLFGSQAMLRYVNTYLYFGVRFYANRIGADSPALSPEEEKRPQNTRPFPLAPPPVLRSSPKNAEAFSRFLSMSSSDEKNAGLAFLDGIGETGLSTDREPGEIRPSQQFELWLRGLQPEAGNYLKSEWASWRDGLISWAQERAEFYFSLAPTESSSSIGRPAGGYIVQSALAARIAFADFYWIASLLRADVSGNGAVTYHESSWLHLLRFQAELENAPSAQIEKLRRAEEVLRSVFDFVCDLIQNSIEVSTEKQFQVLKPERRQPSSSASSWRKVFDEELKAIDEQRDNRHCKRTSYKYSVAGGAERRGWMARATEGRQPNNLIGLALSGGGIRSATFNLGVLKGLQQLDLLRQIDYLSTVSGGGFIGSWLVANVARSRHWLGRLTCWDESIAHLRRYSNYLAPRLGALSTDSWTLGAGWIRNTFLIQITGLLWLLAVLSLVLLGKDLFTWSGALPHAEWGVVALFLLYSGSLSLNMMAARQGRLPRWFASEWLRQTALAAAVLGSFFMAAVLWTQTETCTSLAFLDAWRSWSQMLIAFGIGLLLLAIRTVRPLLWSLPIALACLLLMYGELWGIAWLFRHFLDHSDDPVWTAFVFGPPLVAASITLVITFFIGFSGRLSDDAGREWWTRFGARFSLCFTMLLALSLVAVFGHKAIAWLLDSSNYRAIKWSAVAGWMATTAGGLLAGNSSKTKGNSNGRSSPSLQLIAKAGSVLFIIGGLLGSAALLFFLMEKVGGCDVSESYNHCSLTAELVTLVVLLGLGTVFAYAFDINVFSLNSIYRNRLVRCYLGASRWMTGWRKPNTFTQFDFDDDLPLDYFQQDYRGPFPIVNCSLNLSGSQDLTLHTRHSASFSLTPLYCGADRKAVRYLKTTEFRSRIMLGQAVSISGAAASPNMGYNTSPLVAFLLTMFNVRLGWWMENPSRTSKRPSLFPLAAYLMQELFGSADEKRKFVNISDGGHFENLGIYELVRRRCKVIIASDAECDGHLHFGSLGNLIRICEADFEAKIDIDVSSIRTQKDGGSLSHCAVGKITYRNGSVGYLVYLKASVTGDEDVGIAQYHSAHPTFPHESTADQFFSEDQFETYRRLGLHIVRESLRNAQVGDDIVALAEKLSDVLAPASCASELFIKHSAALDTAWERARNSSALHSLASELMGVNQGAVCSETLTSGEEVFFVLELLQIMENVFLDLRLDDFWKHPDNRGWAFLFMRWARSPRFRQVWRQANRVFGVRFEYFCQSRLGLPRDRVVARV